MPASRTWLTIVFSALAFTALPALSQTAETPQADAGPTTVQPAPQKTLTNDSIIRMASASLSDNLILQAIDTQPGQYTIDADSMVSLKQAGVSERVITAMLNKGRKRLTPAGDTDETPASLTPLVAPPAVGEIGVYYKGRNGDWQLIESEIVHSRSGGWLKSTATRGIIKQDMNGRLNGRESKLKLQTPVEVLIYTPDGVAAIDYDFIRFRVHSDNREFRTMTGGVFHSHGGAERDEVEFHPTKIGTRTYTFTIDQKVGKGQFGILPTGTGNSTNSGRMYTFGITE